MTQAVILAAIDPDAFANFLKYGPLGLAGLVLVVVVAAMSLRKDLSEASERMLNRVLYAGVFCFVAALVAQHFTVPPAAATTPDFSKQRAILGEAETAMKNIEPKLQEIVTMASDGDGCPGHRGIPHGADMASRSSETLGTIRGARGEDHEVAQSLPAAP